MDNVIHPLDIGGVHIENNLVFAPMAGVSDPPFRLLCHEHGAGLVCMEMISAKALQFNNKKTFDLMKTFPEERPVSLQIFGSDPECMSSMAHRIEDEPFDILDINMGCPVQKVVSNGDGSALMKDPKKVEQIVRECRRAISKPLTVKIRKGFDDEHVNAVEIAKICEAEGADAIAVHGRTREQKYEGYADWTIIADVKKAVSIPVIGNGDIKSAKDVAGMYEQTGADGFMIARGAQGDPWIFERIIKEFESGESEAKPSKEELVDTVLRHAGMLIELRGEFVAMRQMRKHAAWYTAGYHGASKLRGAINDIETYAQLEELFGHFLTKESFY